MKTIRTSFFSEKIQTVRTLSLFRSRLKSSSYEVILTVRESGGGRRGPLARRGLEPRAQPAAVVPVVVDELGDAAAAVLVRQVELAARVHLYVVVLRLRVVTGTITIKGWRIV